MHRDEMRETKRGRPQWSAKDMKVFSLPPSGGPTTPGGANARGHVCSSPRIPGPAAWRGDRNTCASNEGLIVVEKPQRHEQSDESQALAAPIRWHGLPGYAKGKGRVACV
ncbi:hypothetical protein R3P38DRAFT_2779624 [Favolaschia claudopus]|uniref:Uncharacterized protein n=1 Tax=Favolaschia claudopus TaxID=2862362 RepID=A0AAW0BFK4_9AGAR